MACKHFDGRGHPLRCAALVGALVSALTSLLTASAWAQSAPPAAVGASGVASPARAAVTASATPAVASGPARAQAAEGAAARVAATTATGATGSASAAEGAAAGDSASQSAIGSASAPEASASTLVDLNSTSRTFPRAESNLTQLGWTLLGVAAAFIAAAWWLRWRRQQSFPAAEGPALEVVRSVALGGRDRLHLVKAGEQYLVVGHTASQITLLSEVSAPTSKRESAESQPPSWNEAQDSMNAFFKQVEQTKISSA